MEAQQQFADQVVFVGIPGLSSTEPKQEFVEATGVTAFPHIDDPDGELWNRFGVLEQRTYVYVNDDGTWRTSGYGSLVADVENLIAD